MGVYVKEYGIIYTHVMYTEIRDTDGEYKLFYFFIIIWLEFSAKPKNTSLNWRQPALWLEGSAHNPFR